MKTANEWVNEILNHEQIQPDLRAEIERVIEGARNEAVEENKAVPKPKPKKAKAKKVTK